MEKTAKLQVCMDSLFVTKTWCKIFLDKDKYSFLDFFRFLKKFFNFQVGIVLFCFITNFLVMKTQNF